MNSVKIAVKADELGDNVKEKFVYYGEPKEILITHLMAIKRGLGEDPVRGAMTSRSGIMVLISEINTKIAAQE